MARIKAIINAFTGGEISPSVWGRTDTDQWPTFLEEMRNVISDPRGGARRRSGLHYVLPTKYPQLKSRLIPFVFSREQSYMMEFGDHYVRFYRDNGYVEDIGSVQIYQGDGTTTKFVYPYPSVLETNIEVYDETGTLVPDVDMVTPHEAIVTSFNYASDFSAAGWDVDLNSSGNPWVKNVSQVTSAVDSDAVLAFTGAQVPIGGAYTIGVDIVSFTYTDTTESSTDATDQSVPVTEQVMLTHTVENDSIDKANTLDYSFVLEDASGTQSSDFTWNITLNGTVVASGTELAVIAPTTISGNGILPDVYHNDSVQLNVSATGNHVQSLPEVSGTVSPTTLSVTYLTNPDAKLEVDVVAFGDTVDWIEFDPVVGRTIFYDSDEESYYAAPMNWVFRAQPGLQITLETPSWKIKTEGYFIEFNTAPALGTIRMIRDGSAAVDAQTLFNAIDFDLQPSVNQTHNLNAMSMLKPIIVRNGAGTLAAGDIFEIQSPFSENELEDLHYAQANDVMIFAIDSHKPWTLTRYNPYDWRFEQPTMTGAPWEDGGYNPLDGYPRTVTWFQERLYFGGTVAKPQTLWGSRAADFYDFTIPDGGSVDPVLPDSPVEYTIAAYTHEAIEWLSSERVLVIGTSSTEHRLAPDQYIATDRLPTVSRMSAYGGAHVMPAFMGNLTVFVQASGASVRTFEQATTSIIEKWDSIELDWMANHLTAPRVKQLGYALNHDSMLFMVTLDGSFLTMTYEPGMGESQEIGWGKHDTDGNFYSCAVMPEGDIDQIWTIVEREIEGVKRKYVEFFDPDIYTDSTLTYPPDDGFAYPPLQQVGGLEHLEGKTVTIKVDGATHPDMTVEDAQVTLNGYYENIEIGLKYIPRIKLQRYAMASEPGNLQGQQGRWVEVWLRLVESAYPTVDGVRASERAAATLMNEAEPIVTADVKVYNIGFDRNKQLVIEQDLPMPMHITAIFGTLEVNQG